MISGIVRFVFAVIFLIILCGIISTLVAGGLLAWLGGQ